MDNQRLKQLAGIEEDLITTIVNEMYVMPVDGQMFGKSDQSEPKDHTPGELSTFADLLHTSTVVGGKKLARDIFKLVPKSLAYEFNHSVWNYKGK